MYTNGDVVKDLEAMASFIRENFVAAEKAIDGLDQMEFIGIMVAGLNAKKKLEEIQAHRLILSVIRGACAITDVACLALSGRWKTKYKGENQDDE